MVFLYGGGMTNTGTLKWQRTKDVSPSEYSATAGDLTLYVVQDTFSGGWTVSGLRKGSQTFSTWARALSAAKTAAQQFADKAGA